MNDTTRLEIRPEVADFLDKVRDRLADLTEEQRDDLLGGLEADISELVDDGGSVAELGDPRAYADELRSAAGVTPPVRRARMRPRMPRRPTRQAVGDYLDRTGAYWEETMASRPLLAQAWEVVQAVRPAWWVLRAWVAVQLLDLWSGPWEQATLVPRFGDDLSGLLLLLAATVVSVLIGMRRLWPASATPGSVSARLALLGLNSFALVMLVSVVNQFPTSWMLNNAVYGVRPSDYVQPGLLNDGHQVRNVFAYDAEGRPLVGVQLYDQLGKPLAIEPDWVNRMRYQGRNPMVYAWRSGEQKAWNVYPLPLRFHSGWVRKDKAWTSDNPPFLPQPPLVAVPPVSLPLPEPPADADPPAGAEPDQGDGGPDDQGAEDGKPKRDRSDKGGR